MDLVIEAVFDEMSLKLDLFSRLEDIVRPEAILATASAQTEFGTIAGQLARLAVFWPCTSSRRPPDAGCRGGRTRQTRRNPLARAWPCFRGSNEWRCPAAPRKV